MTIPTAYTEVKENLDAILADPSVSLDIPAIEKLKLELIANTDPSVPSTLLSQIAQLLPVLQQDPTPLTTLGIKATAFLRFSDITSVDPPVNLIAGLKAPSPPVNLLALSVLGKASSSPAEAAIVANQSDLVASLIEVWLSTSTTEVAQAAFDVLWSLLEVDHVGSSVDTSDDTGKHGTIEGTGLMWRRVFEDREIYRLFYYFCSLRREGTASHLSNREKSVAQGRLMDFVSKVGSLNWNAITTCHHPEIDLEYRSSSLLHFTSCTMVDTKDVLMHMTLLNFYRDLLRIEAPGFNLARRPSLSSHYSSPALDFLVSNKLHQKLLELYLDHTKVDPVDQMFLSSPIMAYISQYAQLYPNHFLQNPHSLLDSILSRILQSLAIPSAQWAHGTVPTGDLTILGSLPRVLLVDATRRSLNPMAAIPTSPANKDCLHTLAQIFHSPTQTEQTDLSINLQAPTDAYREAVAARILYFTYLNGHAQFWQHVVTAADIVAMQDVALAAIALIRAVITAKWQTLSPEDAERLQGDVPFKLPSENQLSPLSSATPGILPKSGAWAILTPPALTTVLPYLFKPPQSYNNFVGGGRGDAENAIWRLATAKYDALVALHDALQGSTAQTEGLTDILRTLSQRVREGPWGPPNQVGSRVEAMEM